MRLKFALRFKKALVTGGSSGIGRAIAEALLREGVEVMIVSRRAEGLPQGARHWRADLGNAADLGALEAAVAQENYDLVVNAAGAGEVMNFDAVTPADAARAWQLMVESPRRLVVAALPALLRAKGALVNVSSMVAQFPIPHMMLYNSAKAALSAQTLSLLDEYPQLQAIDLRPGDIRTGFAESWNLGGALAKEKAHFKKMMDEAPPPEVVVRTLWRALKKGRRGTLRAGSFLQTVLMPLGARLAPTSWVDAIRRAYLSPGEKS